MQPIVKVSLKDQFQIKPYAVRYEQALLELERKSPQGSLVKLEMLRHHFHSRADVFEDQQAYVCVNHRQEPLGVAIGAQVPLCLNGQHVNAGYGFDVRVSPAYRNHGIGRSLAKHLTEHFFIPRDIKFQFSTLKASNSPVLKLLAKSHRNTFLYRFTYLTLPTAGSIKVKPTSKPESGFRTELLSSQEQLSNYYHMTDSGIGLWKTYKLYKLRIMSVHPLVRAGFWIGNNLFSENKLLPPPGAVIKTVTAFNLDLSNIQALPGIARQLQAEGINYLQVCCQPHDAIYQALHQSAVNAYSYYLISTQEVKAQDKFTLDIRCL
jgi:GNAT superfamily N-acetyltransferase